MKRILAIALFTIAVAAGLSFSQGPATPPQAGESMQAALAAKVEALEKDLAATKAQIASIQAYLSAQSKAAASLATTLDASEQAGFTAGINFESRKILLAGWHAALATAQEAVPTATAVATAKPGKSRAR